ncbi:MAG: lipoprotein-releasing system permease protein [Thermoanaerobaculia bacterium]|nr:lipoprotein-releasing system permease protein [Thermoanaerobaculia bacterium]
MPHRLPAVIAFAQVRRIDVAQTLLSVLVRLGMTEKINRQLHYARMNLSRQIAWRYLRRPTDRLVSAVGFVSVLGLVIGVMALVISMALMTGYRGDLQRKLLGGNAEIFVYSVGGPIEDTERLVGVVRQTAGVAEAAPVLFKSALVTTERSSTGTETMLKGIEPSRAAESQMLAKIVGPRRAFNTPEGERGVAVGRYLATKLGVTTGQSISITVPVEDSGSFLPRSASFVVTNVFDTGFYEFDARWLFIDLHEAESLLNAPGAANLLEVKLVPGADLDAVSRAIDSRTEHRYAVSDWRDMNRQLFSMLKIQQLVLFIVIGLIVFVSTFNIVSTLIMTVHEKRKEIGILSSMGAESGTVSRIFVWYGTMVGLLGTATGMLLGVVICWVITRYHLVSFPPEIAQVYFVSSIPFVTRPIDLTIIAAFSLAVSFGATILPSLRAARLNPVEALRHE